MNAKMLEMQYGSLDKCPRVITGKLLEKEEGSFTNELRQKMRYLGHLPLTSQFEIAEIELLPPLVSEDVRKAFKGKFIFGLLFFYEKETRVEHRYKKNLFLRSTGKTRKKKARQSTRGKKT